MHGTPAAGTVSAAAGALTEGMLRSMIPLRLNVAAVVLALTGLGITAMAVRTLSPQGEHTSPRARQAATDEGLPAPVAIATIAQAKRATSQEAKFPEGPISKIEIEGNATIAADKIKPKLLSRVGKPLDRGKLEADLKNLMGTNWFSDITYYLDESSPRSGKWALIFIVREMPRLTYVEFRGLKAISLKAVEDMTGLKAGNRADPAAAWLAVARILRLYVEEGYDLASVKLLEGGIRGDTKIVIEIFEGPRVKVNSIDFIGNQFASSAQLRTIISTRNPTRALVGKCCSDMLEEVRDKLVNYYVSQGFLDVKVAPMTRSGTYPGQLGLAFAISEGTREAVRSGIDD
jgi:outer membrane protein insertion porin family